MEKEVKVIDVKKPHRLTVNQRLKNINESLFEQEKWLRRMDIRIVQLDKEMLRLNTRQRHVEDTVRPLVDADNVKKAQDELGGKPKTLWQRFVDWFG